jgi:hypothetical protein
MDQSYQLPTGLNCFSALFPLIIYDVIELAAFILFPLLPN